MNAIQKAAAIRKRLWSPPNAVPDTGITMRNGRPVRAESAPALPIETLPPPPPEAVRPVVPWANHLFIMRVVALEFDVSLGDILSPRQQRHLAEARQTAMVVTHKLTKYSLPQIGRIYDRDHTTVMHSIQKLRPYVKAIENEMKPESVTEWVVALKERIRANHKVRGSRFPLRTHCSRGGHPFDEANTIIRSDGQRRCRTCDSQMRMLRYERAKVRGAGGRFEAVALDQKRAAGAL